MANKRQLKKVINYESAELFTECVAIGLVKPDVAQEDLDNCMTSILTLQSDMVARVNHPEPGMTRKAYYRTLVQDFQKGVDEIINTIYNLA